MNNRKFRLVNHEAPMALTIIVNPHYRQASNMRHTLVRHILVGNKPAYQSDVVGATLPALLQLHLHSRLNTWLQWIGLQDKTRNI